MNGFDNQQHPDRFCDVSENGGHWMLPICGYEKMPLVTLERAIESLVSKVPNIRHMVWIVKMNCKNPPNSLSPDESASIMLYSMEWYPRENSFYIILNKALRNEDRSRLKPWFLYLKLFLTALSKLPSKYRSIHRGIKKNVSTDYPLGKTFIWWGFSSCTSSINVLENEAFLGKTGVRTLFTIRCGSGKDIHQHSMYKAEDEVLLLAARLLKVVSCMNAGNDLNIIHVEEINPPYPLLEPVSSSGTFGAMKSLPSVLLDKVHISAPYHNDDLEQNINKCPSNKIDLTGQELTDQDMRIVVNQAILAKSCVILDLTSNTITQYGVRILAVGLRNNKYLEELNISYNAISDSGVCHLVSTINSSALKRLDLTENDISNEGAKYIAEILATNTSLLQLFLSENQIGNYGMKLLANVLLQRNANLEILNLSANTNVDDESIDSLTDMLEHNRALKKLDLRYTGFSKSGEKRLRTVANSKRGFELWLSHFT